MTSNSSPSFLQRFSQIFNRPPPKRYGNGRNDSELDPKAVKVGILQELASQAKRTPENLHLLIQALSLKVHGGHEDDSKYIMEHLIQLVASLPCPSPLQTSMTNSFIGTLWNVLRHPPLSYVGDQFTYRAADGSNNNIMYPHIGKAGTPYAKSVVPLHPKLAAPPDPGTLFDALLARKEYKPHPSKISSMFFHLATVVIHDIFNTSPTDPNISETSSYLDLAPLYGSCQDDQDLVRAKVDGLLKPDCFFDRRILGFPPGVGILLAGFNRFHNSIVKELAAVNEGGRFSMPNLKAIEAILQFTCPTMTPQQISTAAQEKYDAAIVKRDEDLFQTARLVTCGLYINVILYDYLRTIIALNRTKDPWILDPRARGPEVYSSQGTPMGVGNQVSCEFNLVYRWHSTISVRDEQWLNDFMAKVFPGKDMAKISVDELKMGLYAFGKTFDPDPAKRVWGGLTRDENGFFDDEALIKELIACTEDCAAAFDSGVPVVLRAVEMLGMEQSRYWNLASLNEFRRFFGLIEHKKFEDINSNPKIAQLLRQFYDHPDNVEMYPGLFIENAKKPMAPGAGLCPNQTIGRAVLSDAVALVRGDRYFTIDYSPSNLTQFGFNSVATDPNVAQGGVLYQLLMRAFPGWYEYNSVYALFPLTIPSENKKILTDLDLVSAYSFNPPCKPSVRKVFCTAKAARTVLETPEAFSSPGKAMSVVTFDDAKGMKEVWDFYCKRTSQLIGDESYELGDYFQVDAVRDVINTVHVQFVAALFGLPLRENGKKAGITDKELYNLLSAVFCGDFLEKDEVDGFSRKQKAREATRTLHKLVKSHVANVSRGRGLMSWVRDVKKDGFMESYGKSLILGSLKRGTSVDDVAKDIIPTAAAALANQVQQSALMLDVYLSEKHSHHWPEIVQLAKAGNQEKLRKYAMEGCRLSTQSFGLSRSVVRDISIKEGNTTSNLKPGDQVFLDLIAANVDPAVFPNPWDVNPDRDPQTYVNYGWGAHQCIGQEINIVANTAVLQCFALLPRLRRAPGPQGLLKSVVRHEVKVFLSPDWGNYSLFPTTMKIQFDGGYKL